MECIPRNPTRLLAQLHKHPYKRGKRKEKVNTTTCLLLSLCVHFSFTCRNLVCSLIFFFFVFKLKVLFFCFCLPSAYIRQVADSSSLVDLPSTKREKKKKNNSNSNKGACRSSALIIPSTLSSSCVPFSPFLRKSPIQSFFFISSFLLLFYSAAVYIRTAAFRSSYFTPLFSRF